MMMMVNPIFEKWIIYKKGDWHNYVSISKTPKEIIEKMKKGNEMCKKFDPEHQGLFTFIP